MLYIKSPTTGLNFAPFGAKFEYTGVNLSNFVLTGTPVLATGKNPVGKNKLLK